MVAAIAGVSLDSARADLSGIGRIRSLLMFVSVTGRHRLKRDRSSPSVTSWNRRRGLRAGAIQFDKATESSSRECSNCWLTQRLGRSIRLLPLSTARRPWAFDVSGAINTTGVVKDVRAFIGSR